EYAVPRPCTRGPGGSRSRIAPVRRRPMVRPAFTDVTSSSRFARLAVLRNGEYLVSSETEPSIRIYDRNGVQIASLPIPAWFAVTGDWSGDRRRLRVEGPRGDWPRCGSGRRGHGGQTGT